MNLINYILNTLFIFPFGLRTSAQVNYHGRQVIISALEQALELSKPEIFNTDQGSQFTSLEFTGRLEQMAIRISMDSRGRVYDNILVERLWGSVKYEEVYLHHYQTVSEARNGLAKYFPFYNMELLHKSLGYQTPYEIYVKDRIKMNPVQASTMHHIQPIFFLDNGEYLIYLCITLYV